MTLKEAIAKRILELSQAKNLSPSALAMLCGIDKSTLYSILGSKSKSPEVATIKKICDGLEISVREFFDDEVFENLEQVIQ